MPSLAAPLIMIGLMVLALVLAVRDLRRQTTGVELFTYLTIPPPDGPPPLRRDPPTTDRE